MVFLAFVFMENKVKKAICPFCEKNEIDEGWFRCDECAEKAIMDPNKKNVPLLNHSVWKRN